MNSRVGYEIVSCFDHCCESLKNIFSDSQCADFGECDGCVLDTPTLHCYPDLPYWTLKERVNCED